MKKMNEKQKALILLSLGAVLLALFFILIALLFFVDNQRIEIDGQVSNVGLYSLNNSIFKALSFPGNNNKIFDIFSDVFLYLSFVILLVIVVREIIKIIKLKSIKAFDKGLINFAIGGLILVFAWPFFNAFVVNYRPILVNSELDPSFPSTHVMIATYIYIYSSYLFVKNFSEGKDNKMKVMIKIITYCSCGFFVACEIFTRVFANVHWFTDIIGGILFAVSVLLIAISSRKLIEIKMRNTIEESED